MIFAEGALLVRTTSMNRVGIIPFETLEDAVALLFVTSQTRGRWILPKGKRKAGETHKEACHREGFEEAGVRGVVLEDFPTTVVIGKQTNDGVQKTAVVYYPYLVQKQEDVWPEMEKRERHWALIEDAPKVAYRDDFLILIKQFEALRPWIKEAVKEYKS